MEVPRWFPVETEAETTLVYNATKRDCLVWPPPHIEHEIQIAIMVRPAVDDAEGHETLSARDAFVVNERLTTKAIVNHNLTLNP
jgi:hypothetical protein